MNENSSQWKSNVSVFMGICSDIEAACSFQADTKKNGTCVIHIRGITFSPFIRNLATNHFTECVQLQ